VLVPKAGRQMFVNPNIPGMDVARFRRCNRAVFTLGMGQTFGPGNYREK
jgi:hypothetical protein